MSTQTQAKQLLKESKKKYECLREVYKQRKEMQSIQLDLKSKQLDENHEEMIQNIKSCNELLNRDLEYELFQSYRRYSVATEEKELKKARIEYEKLKKTMEKKTKEQKKILENQIKTNQREKAIVMMRLFDQLRHSEKNLLNELNHAYELWLEQKKMVAYERNVKYLSKEKIEQMEEDVCGICLDRHTKGDTVLTNCQHSFGQVCFQQWQTSCSTQRKCVSCPLCKKKNPKMIRFKEKEKKKPIDIVFNQEIDIVFNQEINIV